MHRDLKLANILVSDKFIIKIGDFGFAKYFNDNTLMNSMLGTPSTMAPEIIQNHDIGYDEKCDIWSLGIIIY